MLRSVRFGAILVVLLVILFATACSKSGYDSEEYYRSDGYPHRIEYKYDGHTTNIDEFYYDYAILDNEYMYLVVITVKTYFRAYGTRRKTETWYDYLLVERYHWSEDGFVVEQEEHYNHISP